MRGRIIRGLCAAAAASAASALGCAAAGASPAVQALSGGAPEYTCAPPGTTTLPCEAGYEADGRNFRYAQAIITVPNRGLSSSDPAMYVGLERASNESAVIGVRPHRACVGASPAGHADCAATPSTTSGWELFYHVESGGSTDVVDFSGPAVAAGTSGVLVSVYFSANQRSINFQATVDGINMINSTVPVSGSLYTEAEAVADWRYPADGVTPVDPTNPATDTRVTQFLDGRFTTGGGDRGTFNGPWTLVPASVTSNGNPPGAAGGGTLIAEPSYLWTDTLTLNGKPGDAFGVWLQGSGVTPPPT